MTTDKDIQRILDTKGLSYVLEELKKWSFNKEEQLRAYSPEDKKDILAFKGIQIKLDEAIEIYK